MFCKVCKATRETTSTGTCSSCGSSSFLHEVAANLFESVPPGSWGTAALLTKHPKLYRFDVGKEVAKRSNPGKPEWSHSVRMNISRREAIDVMRTLLGQMTREDEPIGVTLFGELAEENEEKEAEAQRAARSVLEAASPKRGSSTG